MEKGPPTDVYPMRVRLVFALFLFSFSFFLFQGCAAVNVLAYKVAGPRKIDAKYVPAKTPLLVLAENRQQPSATIGPEVLSAYVIEELSTHNVAPIVPAEKLQALRDSKPGEFSSLSVSGVGKGVGAAQILYVQFDRDDVTPLQGGEAMQGQMQVRVKMIDAKTGATLWPTDITAGYGLSTSSTLGSESSRGSVMDVRRKMYLALADQIAKLFYKWQPEDQRPQE